MLGAGCDQCVQVALQRSDADGRDCGESDHQREAAHVGGYHNADSSQGGQYIAPDVQLIHTAHFLNHIGKYRKRNDHSDIDTQRQVAEQPLVAQDVLGIISTHANDGSVELGQNVAAGDDHIVLVLQQKLEGLQEGQLVLLFPFLFHFVISLRKLLDGEYGQGVCNQAEDRVNDGDQSPTHDTAAKPAHCKDGNGLNDDLGCKCEDEAEGTDLNTLAGVLGDQCGQRCVCDVVCGEENCIQQSVGQEEENVLCGLAPAGGNGEASNQSDCTADIGPEHPGTGFAHLGFGLIDHSSEEEVGNTVKNFGKRD